MTRQELAAIGLATFGMNWQSPLARALGMSPRHIRRLASGDSPITESIAADIGKMLGASAIADPDWPRDVWIVGDAADEFGARREYIVHTKRPRFVARIVACTDDGLPEPAEEPADILTGTVYASGDYVVCEIVWHDAPPTPDKIHALLEEACHAIDASASNGAAVAVLRVLD